MRSRRYGGRSTKYRKSFKKRRVSSRRPYRKRKGFRSRGFGGVRHALAGSRVGKYQRRAISNVASTKKRSVQPSAVADGAPLASTVTLTENQYFFIWSPTYLERSTRRETDATRNKRDIFFRGVKEKWFVRTDDVPWTHRRVVFFGSEIIDVAAPYFQTSAAAGGPPTTYRPLGGRSRLTFADTNAVLQTFFQGTPGRDWQQQMAWDAKFDNQKYRVLSDTRRVFNPSNQTGKMGVYDTWVEINLPMHYWDQEWGDDVVAFDTVATALPNILGWAETSAKSPGQLYFLDIFSRGPDSVNTGSMLLGNQATVYWHEK